MNSSAAYLFPEIQMLVRARKYIWVDRYCIDQDNALEKKMMLQSMDAIYENSFATLVALYGDSDRCGLPGVSSTSRAPQLRFNTQGGR